MGSQLIRWSGSIPAGSSRRVLSTQLVEGGDHDVEPRTIVGMKKVMATAALCNNRGRCILPIIDDYSMVAI